MTLKTAWTRYGSDGKYVGYVAYPAQAQTPLPAVIVFQEIWGVDQHIQNVTERFAQAGYVAFAPDLYAVHGTRPEALKAERVDAVKQFLNTLPASAWQNPSERDDELAKLPPEQGQAIGETFGTLFGGLQMEKYRDALVATASFLRNDYEPSQGQGIASVGYCMGGSLSALLAASDKQLKGAAVYYGSALPDADGVAAITCPVRAFYGELDTRLVPVIHSFEDTMKQAGKSIEVKIYEGANHAFFNDGRPSYHVSAARDAFARTVSFFNEVLS